MKQSRAMSYPSIHFIGIGGCGMNGVAQLAAHAGYRVSGSDRADNPDLFQPLETLGIQILPQDGSGITEQTETVVYSTAIEPDNPDLQKAEQLGIPRLHRAQMLATLCKGRQLIAVAGTAGKSTVTGLLGHIFQTLEKDPTVYCGAVMNNVGSSVRVGSADGPWIIEADESDQSFLHFHPTHAIITNIAEDHFSLEELHALFEQFEQQVSGVVVKQPDHFQGLENICPMLGKHNLENAAHALTLCNALGFDMRQCLRAVASFRGIERRLQRHGGRVIDDFAHSPIKIAAALEAVSSIWPTYNAVWRPHGYTPLFQGLENFVDIFSTHWKQASGTLFILPVFYAGGTVDRKITSEEFVEKLNAAGVRAAFVPDFQALEKHLLDSGLPVLLMGARDPELPRAARRLAGALKA